MDNEYKCVMVIDPDLPIGLIANTAAVLGINIGQKIAGIVGEDIFDADGSLHPGITIETIPLLKGDHETIHSIRNRLIEKNDREVYFADFCNIAQTSKKYDEYQDRMKITPAEEIVYLGIVLYGPKRKVNQLTGSIGLLR